MELCILDIEGTKEELSLNGESDVAVREALDKLEEIISHVGLGLEPTLINIDDSYITTEGNANWYKEEYGWIFSKIEIANL